MSKCQKIVMSKKINIFVTKYLTRVSYAAMKLPIIKTSISLGPVGKIDLGNIA